MTKYTLPVNQSKLKSNVCERVTINFGFNSDWLTKVTNLFLRATFLSLSYIDVNNKTYKKIVWEYKARIITGHEKFLSKIIFTRLEVRSCPQSQRVFGQR